MKRSKDEKFQIEKEISPAVEMTKNRFQIFTFLKFSG